MLAINLSELRRRRMRRVLTVLLLALVLTMPFGARAVSISGVFGGTLNSACGALEINGPCEGLGLGLEVGDRFFGSFAYDSVTGTPLYLNAWVGGYFFAATDVRLFWEPGDGYITYFSILGHVPLGVYMGIGLTNGSECDIDASCDPSIPLPTSLDSDDWHLGAFSISPRNFPPIEGGAAQTEAVRGTYLRDASHDEFFLRTVPEPSTLLLAGLCLAALLVVGGRGRQISTN